MLDLALQVPDETSVFVTGGAPVLVAWGHAKAGPAIERVILGGELRSAAQRMTILPPPRAPEKVQASLRPLLLIAFALACMLLAGAGWIVGNDPFRWYDADASACSLSPGPMADLARLHAGASHESELRLQLAQLSTDAGTRRLQCAPIPAALPQAPVPPRSADVQRAQDRGAKQGKLTIILAWDDRNDLDLNVVCPDGQHIDYHPPRSSCGGVLDVDANGDSRTATITAVESVYFDNPGPGQYRILVDPFAMRVSTESHFRVTVQREGQPDQVIEGVANNGRHFQDVTTVTVAASP
jgi:hypothetical protein